MIWKSFSFILLNKKNVPTFPNLGCKIKILDVDEKYKNIKKFAMHFFFAEIIIFVIKWFKN